MYGLLIVHICAATVSLLAGYSAMVLRKGSRWHGAAGTVFYVAMICMTLSAAYLALFVHPIMLNVVVALLTFYLVMTGRHAAKRRDGGTDWFDYAGLALAVAVGVSGIRFGLTLHDGMPIAMYFVFGSIALLFAMSDVRMLMRGGVTGAQRVARHLWRMCFALLITTMSFFPGQGRLFPKAVRSSSLMYVPHILLIGAMFFWLYRVSVRKRVQHSKPIAEKKDEGLRRVAA